MSTTSVITRPSATEAHPADVAARLDRVVSERTVPAEFLDTVRIHLDRVALRWKEGTDWRNLTWSEYRDRVARVAGGLIGLGIGPGDRILLHLPNSPEFHIIDMAIMSVGATPVSIYTTASPEQIDHIVDDTHAAMAFALDGAAVEQLWASDVVRESDLPIVVVRPDTDSSTDLSLHELERSDPIDLDAVITELDPHGEATIIYTSGTTGPSKGVVLSHHNVLWATHSLRIALGDRDLAGKRIISYLPMAHIAERSTTHYAAASSGYEVTTCPDVSQLADHLNEVRPHLLFGVPRVWEKLRSGVENALAADPDRRAKFNDAIVHSRAIHSRLADGTATDEDRSALEFLDLVAFAPVRDALGLDHLEIAVTGAAPAEPEMIEWFRAIGIPLTEIYGMSESAGPIAWTSSLVEAGTVGPAIPGGEIRLAEDGEIHFRGGNVFVGYLGRDEATAETIDDDGWLHTGDIGELDERGHLRVIDRKKELIITAGGKNVSPANLEAAMRSVPLVAHACAIGDGRPYVTALVALDGDEVEQWASERSIARIDGMDLRRHPEVIAEIESGVERVMSRFSNAERVKEIRVLVDDWSPDSEFLTPTLKLRRRAIAAHYADVIEELYTTSD